MNIVCFGLSHQQAGVDVREAFALGEGASIEAAKRVCGIESVEEAVVLSTCNRTEYYAVTTAGARELCARHFAESAHSGVEQFYHHDGMASIEHLFRVVCGMESMVLGETEILGQTKKAYQAASANGTTSRYLNKLFQRAFLVAKQVRTPHGHCARLGLGRLGGRGSGGANLWRSAALQGDDSRGGGDRRVDRPQPAGARRAQPVCLEPILRSRGRAGD